MTDAETAIITIGDESLECPIIIGTEGERGIDISKLKSKLNHITYDEGFANTGSCQSNITYINGEKGILRYRGYPIEQLAESSRFVEVAWLTIWGKLPTKKQYDNFSSLLSEHAFLHDSLLHHFDGFPALSHPMAILSAMINVISCYHPELMHITTDEMLIMATAKIMSKMRTIAAYSYRKTMGLPFRYPNVNLKYCGNFLHMMFSLPYVDYEINPEIEKALNLFLILHADHGQNCSTSTARMVASSQANLFGSISAAVNALWGMLHGGANMAVLKMLDEIHQTGKPISHFIEQAKDKNNPYRLMGFGHRVYKNFDPRAIILKKQVDKVLKTLDIHDPLLKIAKELEDIALNDSYFSRRSLYPNVDFYSGILLRALKIPENMFTVMFAMGRIPGWIAHWKEVNDIKNHKIYRPRQIYQGHTFRDYKRNPN